MLPETGTFALILALCLALFQTGALFAPTRFLYSARMAAVGQTLFLLMALLCLMGSLLQNDVTVIYVLAHSHPTLPLLYRAGATWGGHEGSLLLWCLILAGWSTAFVFFATRVHALQPLALRTAGIMGVVSAGFLLFLLITSNPFLRHFPAMPVTGADLVPVLQDPGLIFHPPLLYAGYVGFVIPFSLAIALLTDKQPPAHWAAACRPWVLLPWSLLGIGIVAGSHWSYRELGWGGWWFWDPVENASLMPWLAATALLHSLMVTEKKQAFAGWTLLLALLTFALSLLGTFLVRSGVLVSVHAFATDPARGLFLLAWLVFLVGGSLSLYALRAGRFARTVEFSPLSRETFLLVNTVLLLTAIVILLTGTLYPILLDVLNAGKISVGEPYFTTLFRPLMLVLLLLMAVVVHLPRRTRPVARVLPGMLAALVMAYLLPWLADWPFRWLTFVGLFLALWMLTATLQHAVRTRGRQPAMVLAHAGVAILAMGVTLNRSFDSESQFRIAPQETVHFSGYDFSFIKPFSLQGANHTEEAALFSVSKAGKPLGLLAPGLRTQVSHGELFPHAAILKQFTGDFYMAPGHIFTDGSWSVRIYYRPFVRWIWAGGLLLAAGGLLPVCVSFFAFFNFFRRQRRETSK